MVLTLLGCLPFANWIAGGRSDPAYASRWAEWGYGTAICIGVAILAVIIARGTARWTAHPAPTPPHTIADALASPASAGEAPQRETWAFRTLLFALAFALYATIARLVFSGRPLTIDELVQVFQAHIFATGRLALPVAPHREFFSALNVVDLADKVYSQFPAGWPAMLSVAERLHATWLAGPFCGAVSVVLFAHLVRLLEPEAPRRTARARAVLFAITPFAAFQFGSHMNHGPTLMWLLLAMVLLGEHVRGRSAGLAFGTGLALGAAATLRPLDAFAFALPAGAWLSWRAFDAWRTRKDRTGVVALVASGVGVALPMSALLYVNFRTTGAPLAFGYEVLWGSAHGIGFHVSPWGASHTPARGVELLSLYVTRLQTYLFETPFPALLPAIVALALTRRLRELDRYVLIASTFLGALYLAYWHDGFFLGPRFVVCWLPALVLWTARFPSSLLGARLPVRAAAWRAAHAAEARTFVHAFLWTGAVMATGFSLPVRVTQYRSGLTSTRVDYSSAAAGAGVRDALVIVRESWGAQLVARMWSAGVSRSASETLYARVDACALDRTLRDIEAIGARDAVAESRLWPLINDSALVRGSPFSPDSTEKYRPGAPYDAVCVARMNDDRSGYVHFAPLLLERANGNVYARDLQARDSLLLRDFPERQVYLLRHLGPAADAPLEWLPLRRDSLLRAWRSPAH